MLIISLDMILKRSNLASMKSGKPANVSVKLDREDNTILLRLSKEMKLKASDIIRIAIRKLGGQNGSER